MTNRSLWLICAVTFSLWSHPSLAAKAVEADAIVHITRVSPTHRLVETSRLHVDYGTTADSFGYSPRGVEKQALAPAAFDVDSRGRLIVADPVRRQVIRVDMATPTLSPLAQLPIPFSDIAVDHDGKVYVIDGKSKTMKTVVGSAVSTTIPGANHNLRFIRHGNRIAIRAGTTAKQIDRGKLANQFSSRVIKCNAEAGLLTLGGKRVQVEIGGPLASVQLVGVNAGGDAFLLFEQFRKRGQLEVDRRVVVINATGTIKAMLAISESPTVHPSREFVLGPNGAFYQMIPGTQGVTFVRWEVRQ